VVFYTRAGCCLCDEALALLRQLSDIYPVTITIVDIDGDPALQEHHGERVPVIAIGGRERMWGKINRALLQRLLRAETRA
jgi:hypothetical protein